MQQLTVELEYDCRSRIEKVRKVLGEYGGRPERVWMELCYRQPETLEDMEEVARWWQFHLV